jgi:hypothetical protein
MTLEEGEVSEKTITPYQRSLEIKRATRYLEYMLKLSDKDGKDGGADLAAAKKALTDLKATDMAAAALVTQMPGEAAFVMWNRARRALHAIAPLVVMRLADKIDSASAPGSERILSEVARGLGLLVPGAPVDEGEREGAITKGDLADLPTDELRRKLLKFAEGE